MKRVILSTRHPGRSHWRLIGSIVAFVLAFFLTACGDDDSDFITRGSDDSSSSECEDCDDGSSSSVTPKLSSSAKSSSSSAKSSSSSENYVWSVSKESFLNPNVKYDSIVDARDGQVYKVVKIDDQWWMAENLNYKSADSWCYGNNEENCKVAGRLYTWAAAMDSAGTWSTNGAGCGNGTRCTQTYPVRGVCPEGWFLPTNPEWRLLAAAADRYCPTTWCEASEVAKYLKSQAGWDRDGGGTDGTGFSAIPAGFKVNGVDAYSGADSLATFWSASEHDSWNSDGMTLRSRSDSAYTSWVYSKGGGYSVRCYKPLEVQVPPCKTDSTDTCEYGTLTDERDGQIYRTVKIGDQWWMAQNLNYAYPESDDGLDTLSYCYESLAKNCDVYGRLYTWSAAMDSAAVFSENGKGCGYEVDCSPTMPVRGICPEGWHLPDTLDWGKLFTAIGGKQKAGKLLKTDTSWSGWGGGDDAYRFSVISVQFGRKSDFDGNRGFKGLRARFWTSRQDVYFTSTSIFVLYYEFLNDKSDVGMWVEGKKYGLSVRCVQD